LIKYIKIKNVNYDYYLQIPLGCNRSITAYDAAIYTVEYIVNNYPAPYTLCLSGGVDSQSMLYSWVMSGKKFETFSAVYNNGWNLHDLETLDKFSKIYNVKINYVDVDVLNFLFQEYPNYAEQYRCGSPHICTHMKFVDIINQGTAIFSGEPTGKYEFVSRNNFGLYKYAMKANKSVVPWFFLETPEINFGLKYDNTIFKISRETPKKDYSFKVWHYRSSGFPVMSQERKFTGFEKIKDYFDENYSHMVTMKDRLTKNPNQSSTRTFDLLLRNKYEHKYAKDVYEVIHKNDE
jgi:hypothetical protein